MAIDPQAELLRLRTALRDLVALSTIPAAWVGRDPPAIAAGLADVLVESLLVDFAFVRLCDPNGGAAVEVTRGDAWPAFPEWRQHHLAVVGQLSRKEIIPDVGGGVEPCRGVVIPIGVNAEGGLVAAACDRPDFPDEIDQLLLSVAANQAATAFQSARLIHERKRAEAELRQARNELEIKVAERTAEWRRTTAELQTILDASPVGIALFGRDQTVQRCNPAFERILGWTADEMVGRPMPVPAGHQEEWSALAQRLQRGEAFAHVETRLLRKDGSDFDAAVACAPLEDEAGRPAGFVGTIEDISDRKRAEEALRRSEAYLAEAQRLSHTGSWAWNILTGEVFWSQEMFRMFGYDPGMQITLEKIIQERVHPEDVSLFVQTGETAIREKKDLEDGNRIVCPDGSIRFHHAVAHPVVNAAGEVVELVGTTMDVTEQHTARTALEAALDDVRKSEDRLRQTIDTIPAHVSGTQPDGSLDFINQRWREYFGLSLAEAQGWGWTAVLHPEDRTGFVETWRTALATGEPWEAEARWRRADGEYRWFHVGSVPLRDESGNIERWYAASTDIDDRKRAEEQWLLTKYSIDHAADYAFWAAPDARLVFVNDAGCQALGYTRDELLQLTVHDINPDFPSAAWEDHWKDLRASQSLSLESTLRRKNGQVFPVELSLNYLLYNGREYGFCFARDITPRQQRDEELQRLTTRVLQLQDDERRRIARDLHDVTAQDLGAVAVNLALLRRLVTDLKPEAQHIVTESASLAEAVLQQIRTLSYLLHPPLLDQVGLASALRWYAEGFTKRSGIHVDIEIARDLGRPSLDIETALFRIVQESLTNVHRHSGSGSATIRLVRAGERMALHVKDQGSGMIDAATGAIADHVQSLGLGILGMRQRLRQFGGQLEIKTSHHGTEIIATVPLTSAPTGQRTRGSVRGNDDGGYPTGGRSRDHAARVAWSPGNARGLAGVWRGR